MVKAAPSAAFVVAEPHFLLEFEIVAFDPPSHLRQIDQVLERDVGWQRAEPVVVRFGVALRPFDQQPLFSALARSASYHDGLAARAGGQSAMRAIPRCPRAK